MTDICSTTILPAAKGDALRYLPEGPYANGEGVFSWVAIQHGGSAKHGSLNVFDLATLTNESYTLPGRPGFAFPCSQPDWFVIGCERTLGWFHPATGHWVPFCEQIDADVDNTIINDGLVLEDNLIFGTKDLEFATKKAGLYLWRGRDQKLIRLRDDQLCSNGKAVRRTSEGLELIDIDSPTRQVVSYQIDVAAGTIGEPRVVLDLTSDPAVPDGAILTPDESGLIVSMFLPDVGEYGETRLYDLATGELTTVWRTDQSPQNTCPALVRHDGQLKLIITTAVEHMTPANQQVCPNAGKIFIATVDLDDTAKPLAPVLQVDQKRFPVLPN